MLACGGECLAGFGEGPGGKGYRFLGIAFVMGTALLPVGRYLARQALHRARAKERGWSRRVLVVGDASHVIELAHQLRREWYAGYEVVGACIPDSLIAPVPQFLDGVPVVGSFRNILEAAAAISADTVAVTGSTELTARRLRAHRRSHAAQPDRPGRWRGEPFARRRRAATCS